MILETMDYYDCEIIKSKRDGVEMCIDYGWYEYDKEKNLKVVDRLLCHNYFDSQMLTSICWDMSEGTMLEGNVGIFIFLFNYYY